MPSPLPCTWKNLVVGLLFYTCGEHGMVTCLLALHTHHNPTPSIATMPPNTDHTHTTSTHTTHTIPHNTNTLHFHPSHKKASARPLTLYKGASLACWSKPKSFQTWHLLGALGLPILVGPHIEHCLGTFPSFIDIDGILRASGAPTSTRGGVELMALL